MTQVTDEMVEAFWAARNKAARDGLSDDEIDKAGIAAALAAMWRPIEEADKSAPILIPAPAPFHIRTVYWAKCPFMGSLAGHAWRDPRDPQLAHNPTYFMPLFSPPKE